MSVREQNKADKRDRIKAAARSLFSDFGYEKTTLRQVAERAEVALGTIMLYADDKRDLVLLMYNDEITSLIRSAEVAVSPSASVVDNLCSFSKVFYEGFARDLSLSRTYLQLNFYVDSMNTLDLEQNRKRKLEVLAWIYGIGQASGEVRCDIDAASMAATSLLLHRAAIRSWVAGPRPEPTQGIIQLREMLKLVTEGFGATRRGRHARMPLQKPR